MDVLKFDVIFVIIFSWFLLYDVQYSKAKTNVNCEYSIQLLYTIHCDARKKEKAVQNSNNGDEGKNTFICSNTCSAYIESRKQKTIVAKELPTT